MILIISPAKRLDFKSPAPIAQDTKPSFLSKSKEVINELKKFSPEELGMLLNLKEKLAQASWERHQNWSDSCNGKLCKSAVFAYHGDVYQGMQPKSFSGDQNKYMENHLRILSSVYGLLGPLELIQPYRLQMDTPLSINGHKDLYSFWKAEINLSLTKLIGQDPDNTLINLASDEYFKVINTKQISGKIIKPVFKQNANGKYKVVSIHAKRARGMMCRFIIENQLEDPEHLKLFDWGRYLYSPDHSDADNWVFLRE